MSNELQNVEEHQLIGQALDGSAESFGALAARYKPRLLAFLHRRCRSDDVEDLAQEALLRAYQHLRSFDASLPFGNWLMAIAANLAANHRRDGARTVIADVSETALCRQADAATATADATSQEGIWAQVQQYLPARQYAVVHCRYAQGLSVKQTARAVGISSIYVKVLLHRARRRLLGCERFVSWVGRNT